MKNNKYKMYIKINVARLKFEKMRTSFIHTDVIFNNEAYRHQTLQKSILKLK